MGILLNFHASPEGLLLIIFRLVRENQKMFVTWHILKMIGTYHDILERNLMMKAVRLLVCGDGSDKISPPQLTAAHQSSRLMELRRGDPDFASTSLPHHTLQISN